MTYNSTGCAAVGGPTNGEHKDGGFKGELLAESTNKTVNIEVV
jgi:hypothetical protein